MYSCLLLALICCTVAAEQPPAMRAHRELTVRQLDALHATIEATPTELHVGDVIFVRISVTNKGNEPLLLPAQNFPNCSLRLDDVKHNTSFTIPRGAGFGQIGPQEILPGQQLSYLGGSRLLVNVPPLPCVKYPFWNPETLSKDGYSLSFTLWVGRRGSVGARGPTLTIRPRPKAEMAKLLELCRPRPQTWRDFPPNWDSSRPGLSWFGFLFPPARASTPENLATLEAVLSPGTLRDFVRLTRRAQAVYDAEDMTAKRNKLAELLTWLERFPGTQRKCMTRTLIDWADNSKRLGVFGYEIAVEAALRPSLLEGDLNTRRAWLKRRLQGPLAAPYLKDFEERIKGVEKGPKEGRNQGDSRAQDGLEQQKTRPK